MSEPADRASDGPVQQGWFAVRSVFVSDSDRDDGPANSYEERITLWEASSADEAIALAEGEADEYSDLLELEYMLLFFQSYFIGETRPGHGDEIFSLIRDSDLDTEEYISRYFDTGTERTQHWTEDPSGPTNIE